MDVLRVVDAFCASCDEVRPHTVMADDPSSCFCDHCGTSQTLVAPLDTPRDHRGRPGRGEIWFSDAGVGHQAASPRSGPATWPADRVLAGMGLLAEALQHLDDVAEMRDCAAQIQSCADALRHRRQSVSAGDRRTAPYHRAA